MHYKQALITGFALMSTILLPITAALGINCRGSGLCPLANWENHASESIIQILRDALYQSVKDPNTLYHSGDHIICIAGSQNITLSGTETAGVAAPEGPHTEDSGTFSLSGNLHTGGICLFPQGSDLTLGQARPLVDSLLEHGCGVCGSVPVHFVDQGSNDPEDGILTFNYVKNPICIGECIGGDGQAHKRGRRSARFVQM